MKKTLKLLKALIYIDAGAEKKGGSAGLRRPFLQAGPASPLAVAKGDST